MLHTERDKLRLRNIKGPRSNFTRIFDVSDQRDNRTLNANKSNDKDDNNNNNNKMKKKNIKIPLKRSCMILERLSHTCDVLA